MVEDKVDYSKIKTHGGVTTDLDGEAHPTALSDQSRAAHVEALKNEQAVLRGRADNGDDVAKRRADEIGKQLGGFREKPARGAQPETA